MYWNWQLCSYDVVSLVESKVVQFSVSLSAEFVVQGAQLLQKSQIRLALTGLTQKHQSLCGGEVLLLHQICSHNGRGTRITLQKMIKELWWPLKEMLWSLQYLGRQTFQLVYFCVDTHCSKMNIFDLKSTILAQCVDSCLNFFCATTKHQ